MNDFSKEDRERLEENLKNFRKNSGLGTGSEAGGSGDGDGPAHKASDGFERDARRNIIANHYGNIALALKEMGIGVRLNEFKMCIELNEPNGVIKGQPFDGEISDNVAGRVRFLIDETFHFLPSEATFRQVLTDIAFLNSYHPVKDYLNSLHWDGVERIPTFLTVYGGADDTELNRAFGTIWFVAAVRRIKEPGCKFDTLLMLESRQGLNKSSALERLAVKPDWFTSDLPLGSDAKIVIEQTTGAWIVEFPEMTGHNADIEKIKAFTSKRWDKARLAYGHFPVTAPRQWVGCISKNPGAKLQDAENRRFWPVAVQVFDIDAIGRDRDQLWAEAVMLEAAGTSITLDRSLWGDAREVQKLQRTENVFEDVLRENLGIKKPNPGFVALGRLNEDDSVWATPDDVWNALGISSVVERNREKKNMGEALIRLNFVRKRMKGRDHEILMRDQCYYERGDCGQMPEAERRLAPGF